MPLHIDAGIVKVLFNEEVVVLAFNEAILYTPKFIALVVSKVVELER